MTMYFLFRFMAPLQLYSMVAIITVSGQSNYAPERLMRFDLPGAKIKNFS